MRARLFLGQLEKLAGNHFRIPVHGRKNGIQTARREQNARPVYAVWFLSVSCVRSMVPPHPQPGPQQQQQLKSRFTSVSQLLF
jgi:hypothetical protein